MLVIGQQLIREVDLASIGMQEIKTQDTLFLYIRTEPTVPEESPEANAQLHLSFPWMRAHSPVTVLMQLCTGWMMPGLTEEVRQKCCSLYLQ